MSEIVTTHNDGRDITASTYWQTAQAQQGLFFISSNAGAIRLLVPKEHERIIREVRGTRLVMVSRGPYQGRDALEVLFDDDSDAPYSLHVDAQQSDHLPTESDIGSEFVLSLWTHRVGLTATKKAEYPCRYRRSTHLPDLRPWQGNEPPTRVALR